jgi:hypothetical protein
MGRQYFDLSYGLNSNSRGGVEPPLVVGHLSDGELMMKPTIFRSVIFFKEELIMSRTKQICVMVAVLLSIASILLAILSTISADTLIVLLGVGLLVLSAAILQK